MVKLRFIHTADIHLGSFLNIGGNSLPPTIEKAIETATLEGFKRVCDTAIANSVDFVTISGDLYDREARSVKALSYFVEQCERLEQVGIPLFIIAGNHDPLREKQELFRMPSNVKVFGGNQPEIYEVLDDKKRTIARIIGQSYDGRWERKKIHLDYRVPDNDIWNIALLHTQLEPTNSNYIPCSVGELKDRKDIHFWALGHIHQSQIINNTYPIIAYPGIPQGRDFGEQGRGGCMLVELDPLKEASISFVPTAPIIYKRIDVYIDEDPDNIPETLEELEDKIYEYGRRLVKEEEGQYGYPVEGYVVEWIIRGRGIIHDLIKEQEQEALELLIKGLKMRFESNDPFLWTESIILRTEPSIDYSGLMDSSSVFQGLDTIIRQCMENQDIKNKLIKELGDIWSGDGDHETIDPLRFYMDQCTLEEMLRNAKQLIIEKLAEEMK